MMYGQFSASFHVGSTPEPERPVMQSLSDRSGSRDYNDPSGYYAGNETIEYPREAYRDREASGRQEYAQCHGEAPVIKTVADPWWNHGDAEFGWRKS